MWTTAGNEIRQSETYKDNDAMLIPGIHYHVLEPVSAADYFTFPANPIEAYRMFRSTLVLVRKQRHDVVGIEGTGQEQRDQQNNMQNIYLSFSDHGHC